METIILMAIFVVMVELAYMSGYHRWNCPARDLHDTLSGKK